MRSTDGGFSWTAVKDGPNLITNVQGFCFGANSAGESYPSIYFFGFDGSNLGFYMSQDGGMKWTKLASWPNGNFGIVSDCAGDPMTAGRVYLGFNGSGYAYYGNSN
jgi:hypothetical protein